MFEETVYKLQLEYHQQFMGVLLPLSNTRSLKGIFRPRPFYDFMTGFYDVFCSKLLWPHFLSQQNTDITVFANLPSLSTLNPKRIWEENAFFSLLHQPLKMPWILLFRAHPFSNESPPEHWGARGADWKSRAAGVCALSTWFSSAFLIHKISLGGGRGGGQAQSLVWLCHWFLSHSHQKLSPRPSLQRAGFKVWAWPWKAPT